MRGEIPGVNPSPFASRANNSNATAHPEETPPNALLGFFQKLSQARTHKRNKKINRKRKIKD